MTEHFRGVVSVAICPLAARPLPFEAKKALAAANIERYHDAVTDLELLIILSNFHHFAHELMTEDVAFFHGGNITIVEMQVRSAYSCRGDLYNSVPRLLNDGIGN